MTAGVAIRKVQRATSFCLCNKLAQPFAKRSGQLIGNLDSHVHLAQLNAAHVGAVYSSPLSKFLLRQSDLLSGVSNCSTKCPP